MLDYTMGVKETESRESFKNRGNTVNLRSFR